MKRLTIFSLTCLFSVGAVFAQQGVTQCGVPTGQPKFPLLTYQELPDPAAPSDKEWAAVMANKLRAVFGNRVLGPDKPPVARIQTLFIKKIVVKIEQNAPMGRARELLLRIQREMLEDERYKSLIVYYDVDPM